MQTFAPTRGAVAPARIAAPLRPSRAARVAVRAEPEQNPIQNLENKLENEVGPAAREAVETTTQRTVAETAPAAQPDAFGKVFAFSGLAPERVNSRLAMLGIVAALAAEAATGKGVAEQLQMATGPIVVTFAVLIAASIIPILKGLKPEQAENSTFTQSAELLNGRLAMLGFLSLLVTEAIKGSPLL